MSSASSASLFLTYHTLPSHPSHLTSSLYQAWPDWPASSAYVTAVGATQLSDIYLPACTATYDVSRYLPDEIKLNFQVSNHSHSDYDCNHHKHPFFHLS